MISDVAICNMALGHIGVNQIGSLTESSEPARKCSLFYTQSRDSVLRAHDWNFAGLNVALSELASEVVIGWDYVYQYPAKCLSVRKIYNESTDFESVQSEKYIECLSSMKTIVLATDCESAYAEYTYQVTDPALFDVHFIEALSYKLASVLAKPLTGSDDLAVKMASFYQKALEQGASSNKAEVPEKQLRTSPTLDSRG